MKLIFFFEKRRWIDGIPKEGSQCICQSVTLIDSVFKISKNYYLQVFLEECKYMMT